MPLALRLNICPDVGVRATGDKLLPCERHGESIQSSNCVCSQGFDGLPFAAAR